MTEQQIFQTYYPAAVTNGIAQGIAPSMLLAIIRQESAGNFTATGKAGEVGLMQVTQPALTDYNRNTGSNLSLSGLQNIIELQIQVGSWYFAWLRSKFADNDFNALRMYNGGIGNVRKSETISVDYANSVLKFQEVFKNIIGKQS